MIISNGWVVVVVLLIGTGYGWNIFPSLYKNSIGNFTREKLASLRHQRNRLELLLTKPSNLTVPKPESEISSYQNVTIPFPESLNTDRDNNSTSHNLRENLIQQIIPNKEELLGKITEVGDKIVEMKEKLEPEMKKFLTEKYNSFLSNLVPYSETIGVPTYVLNSMKIPQNFDPRLHLVESMLQSVPMKTIMNSLQDLSKSRRLVSDIQGKSDDQDLVSDQEPGATSKQKYPHLHRLSRGKSKTYLISNRNGYEVGYNFNPSDADAASEILHKGYYVDGDDDHQYEIGSDLVSSPGTNVARGHGYSSRGGYGGGGYGHGHGGGHGGGGLTDPFSILGGLAFLTYLAMLIQQQMTTTAAPGRGMKYTNGDTFSHTLQLNLAKLQLKDQLQRSSSSSVITDAQQRMAVSSILQVLRQAAASTPSQPCSNFCLVLRKLRNLPKLNATNPTK